MGLNLTKGAKVDLTKNNPRLNNLMIGLGWDTQKYTGGTDFDLDGSVALVGEDGKCKNPDRFVFYNNLYTDGVTHDGDNLTGDGEGDDERIHVKLSDVDADVQEMYFHVVIYGAESRNQNFGQVSNAFVRVVDEDTNEELARFDLGEDFSTHTRMCLAKLYRHNGEWKFAAIGQGYEGGFEALEKEYGV